MAGGKYTSELLLQGKFEFDQNSLSEAAKFTQELVKTIERPLQDMAQRIVANITGQGGMGQLGGQIIQTNKYGVPTGGISVAPLPTQSQVSGSGSGGGGGSNINPAMSEFMKQIRNEFRLPQYSIMQAMEQRRGEPYSPHQETANMAMFMKKAQGLGMDMYSQMSPEQREQFKQSAEYKRKEMDMAVAVGKDEQREFTKVISKLEDAIRKLKEELPKKMGDELKQGEAKLGALEKQRQEAVKAASEKSEETSGVLMNLAREKVALEEPEAQAKRAEEQKKQQAEMVKFNRRSTALATLQAGVQAGEFYNELPYMREREKAATANLDRGSARALLSGDMERYQVIQELGGDEALNERSRSSALRGAGLRTAGAGLGTAAGLGVASAGLTALGMTGVGLPLAIAGGVGVAAYGAYQYMNMEADATQRKESEIEARTGQTKEFRQASAKARARAERSFDMATATGDRSLEMMFYGAAASEARDPTGRSLASSAAQRGVDYGSLAPVIAELGQRSRTTGRAPFAGAYSPMQDSINLASLGIGAQTQAGLLSAQDTATRLNPREAFAQIKDMYVEAYATGIEKSQLPKAMERFAGMAASIGYGGTNVAQEQMRRATTMAGNIFGEEYGGAQLDFATRIQKAQFGGGPVGSGGFGNAMTMMATSGLLESTKVGGKSLSDALGGNAGAVSMLLAQQGQTDSSMKEILTTVGGMSKEDADKYIKSMGGAKGLTAGKQGGAMGAMSQIGQGPLGFLMTMLTGAEGGAQVEAALKSGKPFEGKTADTLEGRIKAASAREKVEAGEGAGPAGGKIKAARLGAEAEELERSFDVLVQSLPSLSSAVKTAADAIDAAIKTMKEKQNFGN